MNQQVKNMAKCKSRDGWIGWTVIALLSIAVVIFMIFAGYQLFIPPSISLATKICQRELKQYALSEGLDSTKFVIQSTKQSGTTVIFDVIYPEAPQHLLVIEVSRRSVIEFHRMIEEDRE